MHYPPSHYQCDDHSLLVATAQQFPLASLISVVDGRALITHLPLVYYPATPNQSEHFIGHLDARNPQVASVNGGQLEAVFHGPTVYISVHDYLKQSGRLPTYNYIKVHVKGKASPLVRPAEVLQSLIDLTDYMERNDTPWELQPDNEMAQHLIPHIAAFRLEVESWEGKFKLSQDKPVAERERTWKKLLNSPSVGDQAYSDQLHAHLFT
ncbi:MAG: FMN-binding negative transcriptional regulator [Bacteroidota bacterium]